MAKEQKEQVVRSILQAGAAELYTAPGQTHDGIVRGGRDLASMDGKIVIRGYGPSDPQGVVRVYGPWPVSGGYLASYRYFLKK